MKEKKGYESFPLPPSSLGVTEPVVQDDSEADKAALMRKISERFNPEAFMASYEANRIAAL